MQERKNALLTVFLCVSILWLAVAWLFAAAIPIPHIPPSLLAHKLGSLASFALFGGLLFYAVKIKDKLPDDLAKVTLGEYFEQDGLCFMPMTRVTRGRSERGQQQAEISLYYENRFAGPCEAVIHLRPPAGTIHSHPGARDVHFAFRCEGGNFGVIHQPIAVAPGAQGQPIVVQVAACLRWLRSRGEQLRSHRGKPCGTFDVDWAQAYRQSEHELNGEIELHKPAIVHLLLPDNVRTDIERGEYVNEVLASP